MASRTERLQAAKDWAIHAIEKEKDGSTLLPQFAIGMSIANSLILIADVLVEQTKAGDVK